MRTAGFGSAILLHLLAFLLLLWLWAPVPPTARPEQRRLTLWELPPPPPPPQPLPQPTEQRVPQPQAPPAQEIAGGSREGSPPASLATPPAVEPPPLPLVPVRPTAPAPIAAPSTGNGGSTGEANGSGAGASGTGSGDGTGAGSGRGGAEPAITVARWVRRPGFQELNPSIPSEVRKRGISGTAYLVCRVQRNKHLRNCSVLKETPAGSGFGAAALAASPKFRIYPPEVDGKPSDLAWVIVPIEYHFQK